MCHEPAFAGIDGNIPDHQPSFGSLERKSSAILYPDRCCPKMLPETTGSLGSHIFSQRNHLSPRPKSRQAGIIWYYNDKFYGTFNAAIGKELRAMGANFNSLDKTYFIKAINIPMNIRAVISESSSKFKRQRMPSLIN